MRILLATLFSLALTTPVLAQTGDPLLDSELQRTEGLIQEGNQAAESNQQTGEQYEYYVYTHLQEACNAGDSSACQEQQCRVYELQVRLDMMHASSASEYPIVPRTGIDCGSVRYRW